MKLLNMNKFLITTALIFGFVAFGYSQQLVYTPKNPNFGGANFNYSWLLSSAQAQNKFKVEEDDPFAQQTQLEQIQEDLNSSVGYRRPLQAAWRGLIRPSRPSDG